MGRAGWAVGRRSRIDGKGPCWPTAREGRWFLGDAVHGADFRKQRAPDTCPIKEACRRQRGRPTRPTPASRKDGSSLLLQGRARPRPSPRVRAVRPAFEGEHTQLLTDAPRAPLETDVPKSRRSLLLLSHRPEAAAVPCISSEEDRAAPRGRPCAHSTGRAASRRAGPSCSQAAAEERGHRVRRCGGRSGLYLLRLLGAGLQRGKTRGTKTTAIIIIIFFKTLSTTFSHFFIFYILTKLFLNKYKII